MNRRQFLSYLINGAAAIAIAANTSCCKDELPIPTSKIDIGVIVGSWKEGDYPYSISWKVQDCAGSRGIIDADITGTRRIDGKGSLELTLDIIAGSDDKKEGEVFVDLKDMPEHYASGQVSMQHFPDGTVSGIDLRGKYLSADILCPLGTGGARSSPNGVQIFAKSVSKDPVTGEDVWSSYYGNWHNLWQGSRDPKADPKLGNIIQGRWSILSADLDELPVYGHVDPGFDAGNVALLGIKYGLNKDSREDVSGNIFIDNLGWADKSHNKDVLFTFDQTENPIYLLAKNAFNSGAILQTEYMDSASSTSIAPMDKRSHSDDELVSLIRLMKMTGLKSVLKPHVDIKDGTWRGYIALENEEDKAAWFDSYRNFIIRYAKMAEKEHVDSLIIGTELDSLQGAENKAYWDNIIDAIKEIYKGELTYASNWDSYENVCFWDKLDFAGIDAYHPLSESATPTVEELKQGWQPHVEKMEEFQKKIGKQIAFTEAGYRSVDYTARDPLEYLEDRPANMEGQKNCYQALIDTFIDKPWFKGVYFWNYAPIKDDGGLSNKNFTPKGKPAEQVPLLYAEKK